MVFIGYFGTAKIHPIVRTNIKNNTMSKIICIISVVIAIFSNVSADCMDYSKKMSGDIVCGSDGRNHYAYDFKCKQETDFGKSINLQLIRHGECYFWDEYKIWEHGLAPIYILVS